MYYFPTLRIYFPVDSLFFIVVCCTLCIIGISMMWKSNEKGFWFYITGGLGPSIITIMSFIIHYFILWIPVIISFFMAFTTIIFIIFYKMKPIKK
jgi:hypothetical protein